MRFHPATALCICVALEGSLAQLGLVQQQVPWRADHSASFLDPYVIVYGGVSDPTLDPNGSLVGTKDVWVWDSRNGSWYHPTMSIQVQTTQQLYPQVLARAVELPSPGQMLAVTTNTTGATTNGMLQKLDTNGWSWTFPTSNLGPYAPSIGYAMARVNNTLYTYGGVSIDATGHPVANAVLNSLWALDANAYTWAPASNGAGVTLHSMCYVPVCNCLISFGGTPTGSVSEVTNNLYIYDLGKLTWNVQVSATSASGAAPGARILHTATCLQNRMIIYGGGTTQPFDSDVWSLDVSAYPSLSWERIQVENATEGPGQRMGHTTVYDESKQSMYVFGGWGVGATNDSNMYILNTVTWSWTRVPPSGFPSGSLPPSTTSSSGTPTLGTNTPSSMVPLIIGVTIGGFVVLLLCAVGTFFVWRYIQQRQHHRGLPYQKASNKNNVGDDDDTTIYRRSISVATLIMNKKHASKSGTESSSRHSNSNPVVHAVLEAISGDKDDTVTAMAIALGRNSNASLLLQTQKPNEVSTPIRSTSSVPIERCRTNSTNASLPDSAQPSSVPTQSVPWDSSMEVLQSITTSYSDGHPVAVVHSTSDSSLPVDMSLTDRTPGPIRYIFPGSRQFSLASTLRSDSGGTGDKRTPVPLTHFRYSPISAPLGQPEQASSPRTAEPSLLSNEATPSSPMALLTESLLGRATEGQSDENDPSDSNQDKGSVNSSSRRILAIAKKLPPRYRVDTTVPPLTGMSNTVVFVHCEPNNEAAIKVFGRREAWERECRTLSKLKSSHTVALLEVLTIRSPGSPAKPVDDEKTVEYIMVMERLDETLTMVIRDRAGYLLDTPRSIIKGLAECLAWCHKKGIAFCDLKPNNVMRKKTEQWKLIDFEASRYIGQECVDVITPRYCPPEVAKATTYGIEGASGVVATAGVDLWSLGCILFELEARQPLFPLDVRDDVILHFISHPSPLTPALVNGLRWTESRELDIPELDERVTDEDARHLIRALLQRDPSCRGTATTTMEHSYISNLEP